MRKKHYNSSGFSLVELMVVLSITSTLATLGTVGAKKFRYEALKAEAKLGLKTTYVLTKSYVAESDTFVGKTSCGIGGSSGRWDFCLLSTLSSSSSTSCNVSNPIGFQVEDCRKSNYYYFLSLDPNYPTQWRLDASIKAKRLSNNSVGGDKWVINSCRHLCHYTRIIDVSTGSAKFFDCKDDGFELMCGENGY